MPARAAKSSSPPREEHAAALRSRGVPEPAVSALASYLDLLRDWSRRVNLTGARDAESRVRTLVVPVLPLASWVPRGAAVLDLGSGNGSPGLVLALLRPDLVVTLVEPRSKRWAFLREAVRAVGRPELGVFRGRHEDWRGGASPLVILRALSLPLAELRGLVTPGGAVAVLGRPPDLDLGFEPEPGPAPDIHVFRRST